VGYRDPLFSARYCLISACASLAFILADWLPGFPKYTARRYSRTLFLLDWCLPFGWLHLSSSLATPLSDSNLHSHQHTCYAVRSTELSALLSGIASATIAFFTTWSRRAVKWSEYLIERFIIFIDTRTNRQGGHWFDQLNGLLPGPLMRRGIFGPLTRSSLATMDTRWPLHRCRWMPNGRPTDDDEPLESVWHLLPWFGYQVRIRYVLFCESWMSVSEVRSLSDSGCHSWYCYHEVCSLHCECISPLMWSEVFVTLAVRTLRSCHCVLFCMSKFHSCSKVLVTLLPWFRHSCVYAPYLRKECHSYVLKPLWLLWPWYWSNEPTRSTDECHWRVTESCDSCCHDFAIMHLYSTLW
jgi:hypothetical protein